MKTWVTSRLLKEIFSTADSMCARDGNQSFHLTVFFYYSSWVVSPSNENVLQQIVIKRWQAIASDDKVVCIIVGRSSKRWQRKAIDFNEAYVVIVKLTRWNVMNSGIMLIFGEEGTPKFVSWKKKKTRKTTWGKSGATDSAVLFVLKDTFYRPPLSTTSGICNLNQIWKSWRIELKWIALVEAFDAQGIYDRSSSSELSQIKSCTRIRRRKICTWICTTFDITLSLSICLESRISCPGVWLPNWSPHTAREKFVTIAKGEKLNRYFKNFSRHKIR